MNKIYQKLYCTKTSWQIAIQSQDIKSLENISIPSLPSISKEDITSTVAGFVADPFLLCHEDVWYCFFEIKDEMQKKGIIGVSKSVDLKQWEYLGKVLEEPYHLSYPFVFLNEGNIYMMPEGGADKSVKLYKATSFPMKWEYERTLLKGEDFRDTTLFIKEGIFYFFTSQNSDDNLYLYTANNLADTLHPHPQNPLYENNKKISRNGGNIIAFDNRIFRFTQDCSRRYGEALHMMEITTLSKENFSEKYLKKFLGEDTTKPTWYGRKMHHFSCTMMDNKIVYAIDGEGLKKRF